MTHTANNETTDSPIVNEPPDNGFVMLLDEPYVSLVYSAGEYIADVQFDGCQSEAEETDIIGHLLSFARDNHELQMDYYQYDPDQPNYVKIFFTRRKE